MPRVSSEKVTKAKSGSVEAPKKKPKAEAVAQKAKAGKPTSTSKPKATAKNKAAEAALKQKEPKTVTIRLPAGARKVENPELPEILKGVPGLTVKASYVFDVPVSLGSANLNGVSAADAARGPSSFNSTIRNAVNASPAYRGNVDKFRADLGNYKNISDQAVANVKDVFVQALGVKPGFGIDCGVGGGSAWEDCSWYTGKGACLGYGSDKAEYNLETGKFSWFDKNRNVKEGSVQELFADRPQWKGAVSSSGSSGSSGASGGARVSPDKAMKLAGSLANIKDAVNVPRNVSRADVEGAAATLRAGADEVAQAVKGTRGIQTTWGGQIVSAAQVSGLADAMEMLALKMKQAGV